MLKSLGKISYLNFFLNKPKHSLQLIQKRGLSTHRTHNRFINIRKPEITEAQEINQSKDTTVSFNKPFNEISIDDIKKLKNQNNQDSNKFKDFNRRIKKMEKISDLLQFFAKKKNLLTIEQHLFILQKLIKFDNIRKENIYAAIVDNSTSDKVFEHKIINDVLKRIQFIFCRGGFKKLKFNQLVPDDQDQSNSMAPQYYINLINTLSKCSNLKILDHSYRKILLPIIHNQLCSHEETRNKKSPNQNNSFTICSVLTLQDNIKLLSSLMRLLNNQILEQIVPKKSYEEYKQHKKSLIKLSKNIIDHLHIQTVNSLISGKTSLELMRMYLKVRPVFRINRNALKNFIKQQLKRIKLYSKHLNFEGEKKAESSEENQEKMVKLQVSSINTIKKLLWMEALLRTHVKEETLKREIESASESTVIYHQFFLMQHKIHRFMRQELLRSMNPHKLNQHLQLLSNIADHIVYLYEQISFSVLAKADIIPLLNQQIHIVIKYLKALSQHVETAQSEKTNNSNEINRLKWQINKILSILVLKTSLRQKIPAVIINTKVQQQLLNLIFRNFKQQTKPRQYILLAYLIENDKQILMSKVFSTFIEQEQDWNLINSKKTKRGVQSLQYLFNLVGNKKYLDYLKSSSHNLQEQSQKNSFKYSMGRIFQRIYQIGNPQIDYFLSSAKQNSIIGLANILNTYFNSKQKNQQLIYLDILMNLYIKESNNNIAYSKQNIQRISQLTKALAQQRMEQIQNALEIGSSQSFSLRSHNRTQINSYEPNVQIYNLRAKQIIRLKVESMLKRTSLMFIFMKELQKNSRELYKQRISILLNTYQQQLELLKFPKLYSNEQLQILFYLDKLVAISREPAVQSKQENNSQEGENSEQYKRRIKQFSQKYEQIKFHQLSQNSRKQIDVQIQNWSKATQSTIAQTIKNQQIWCIAQKVGTKTAIKLSKKKLISKQAKKLKTIYDMEQLNKKYGTEDIHYIYLRQ